MQNCVQFRFYEELNDFLPEEKQKTTFSYYFDGSPAVKDSIEALGIPHTEVDLIIANGKSVDFNYHLKDGDRIAVYPVFESIDISPICRLASRPLRKPRFILDVHLGKLSRLLRLLGFDCLYDNHYDDSEIVNIALEEGRIILSRDRGLLKRKAVSHGYCVRSDDPIEQAGEVLRRFDLENYIRPLSRCTSCNGFIREVPKEEIEEEIEPKTRKYYQRFFRCENCGKIYWRGAHYERIIERIQSVLKASGFDAGSGE